MVAVPSLDASQWGPEDPEPPYNNNSQNIRIDSQVRHSRQRLLRSR